MKHEPENKNTNASEAKPLPRNFVINTKIGISSLMKKGIHHTNAVAHTASEG